jgi:hypothetical protein
LPVAPAVFAGAVPAPGRGGPAGGGIVPAAVFAPPLAAAGTGAAPGFGDGGCAALGAGRSVVFFGVGFGVGFALAFAPVFGFGFG